MYSRRDEKRPEIGSAITHVNIISKAYMYMNEYACINMFHYVSLDYTSALKSMAP